MRLQPPLFLKLDGGFNAVDEFQDFIQAVKEPAAHLLAELADIHNGGSEVPHTDEDATSVQGLNCRLLRGWAVFYTVDASGDLTVIHVAEVGSPGFAALEGEADRRMRTM